MESIKTLFTSEDISEVKQEMKKLIVKQFESELEELDIYLFDYNMVNNLINETYEEIMDELKGEIREKLYNKVIKQFDL
jgi:predicted aldo/keto reductase-like oxidoreductase